VPSLTSPFARVAPAALVVVVLLLGATAVSAALTIRKSSANARYAATLNRTYQDAVGAVREQDFWVTEYLVRLAAPEEDLPAAKLRAEHARTTRDLMKAFAIISRVGTDSDRELADYVIRSQPTYRGAVQQLFGAVDRGDATGALHYETGAVDPAFETYEERVEDAASAHRHAADRRFSRLDSTGRFVLIVALLVSALGLVLAVPLAVSLRRSRTALSTAAFRDTLTGLHNRRAFARDLDAALASCADAREPLAIALLDLDGLKKVNDAHGHDVGDDLIKTLGAALDAVAVGRARAYRFGGDEFADVVAGSPADAAGAIVAQARQELAAAWKVGDVDVSAGIAERTDLHPVALGGEHDALVREADVALISAKRGERGALVYSWRLEEGFVSPVPAEPSSAPRP
jgi:diguanylate cyclase (GGDEF)-like protein